MSTPTIDTSIPRDNRALKATTDLIQAGGGALVAEPGSDVPKVVVAAAGALARLNDTGLVIVAAPAQQKLALDLVGDEGVRGAVVTTPRGIQDDPEDIEGATVAILADLPGVSSPSGAVLRPIFERAEYVVYVSTERNDGLLASIVTRDDLASVSL
ncbi:hypothetical protein GCM10025867_48640 (plasmid) [Frondihabitans sucicola]|uniref:Uncharacterized protein n=1 Tax=Frondihabitans sucicola TaxID=1268041 RepID=A0ABM8GVW3_9MICO|nr:hypothetical protein [Frondihabitans sucicola]BDZ52623.1 hypothetical protein GCM10025867_48640 [Frondihabitans sucicola]